MLKGKVAIVTGSTSGIGLGIARELAKLGARGELQRLACRGAATSLYASPQQTKKEPATPADDVHALDDLPHDGVVRRQVRIVRGHDEELASPGAWLLVLRLRHGDEALRVGRVRLGRIDRRVAGAAVAGGSRVPALDDEAGHDPVESRAVEEAILGEVDHGVAVAGSADGVDLDGEVPV